MRTEEQEDQMIDAICAEFDQLDKSVDTMDDVRRVFSQGISVLQKHGLTIEDQPQSSDFPDAEDGEVITVNTEACINDDDGDEDVEDEFLYTFEYGLVDGKYLIFADLDFHNADDDTETPNPQ